MTTTATPPELAPAAGIGLRSVPQADSIAERYRVATAPMRARLLESLPRPLGTLASVAVAGGVFGALRSRHGWRRLQVLEEDTLAISAEQVRELACYLQQLAPEVLTALAQLPQHPGGPRRMH